MTGYDLFFLLAGFVMVVTRSPVGVLFIAFCWLLGQRPIA